MPQDCVPFNRSSIVAGSNEGIPTSAGKSVNYWNHILIATITNPTLICLAAWEHLWYVVAALMSVFLLQAVVCQLALNRLHIGQARNWPFFAIVATTNIVTCFIGQPIFESSGRSVVSFAEIQVMFSVSFLVFSETASIVRPETPATLEKQ